MADDRIIVNKMDPGLVGPMWFAGWLFTFGYLHLHMPKVIFAIVIWPYYLGAHFGHP